MDSAVCTMWLQWNASYTYIIVWRWCCTAAYDSSLWVRAHGGCCGLGNDWVKLKKFQKGQSLYLKKTCSSLLCKAVQSIFQKHYTWIDNHLIIPIALLHYAFSLKQLLIGLSLIYRRFKYVFFHKVFLINETTQWWKTAKFKSGAVLKKMHLHLIVLTM